MKVSEQNKMKSFGEKLIKVANVSYFTYCNLNSVDPDFKKGWSILGGPCTRSRWWSMNWGSVKFIQLIFNHQLTNFNFGVVVLMFCCQLVKI